MIPNWISSLDTAVDPGADERWKEEIARRAEEIQSGKVKPVPWEEVRQKGRTLLYGE